MYDSMEVWMAYVELSVRKVCPHCGLEYKMTLIVEALEWFLTRDHIEQSEHPCVTCMEREDG
jgi:hypothetical protein